MCGICGFWTGEARHSEPELIALAGAMAATLRHRGPDDQGIHADREAGVGLAHRRLSILDLSAEGHQPMRSSCGRHMIVFNGEIYNFRELRSELSGLGHIFRGGSDTEVLIEAIAEWGVEEAVRRTQGMFAFAVWSPESRTLSLARDRLGKKPLYYGWCRDALIFGSELKALLAFPDFHPEIDRESLALYLQFSCVPTPRTIFRGIRKLPPGSILTLDAPLRASRREEARPAPFWLPQEVAERGAAAPFRGSFEEAVSSLDTLLRDAVAQRMVADVPLGALLSGGIDSSTIVAIMQAVSGRPVKTFSIGFRETKWDESAHAAAVAKHLGTDHTELIVTPEACREVIPRIPQLYDEPFADASQIPTFLVSQLAREEVTVALSGDGGDELFCGYNAYPRSLAQWQKLARRGVPGVGNWALGKLSGPLSRFGWQMLGPREEGHGLSRLQHFLAKLQKRAALGHAKGPLDVFSSKRLHGVRGSDFVPGLASDTVFSLTDPTCRARVEDPLQGMMALDLQGYLPDDILVKVDRASMAVGLEVRCPLLDWRVAELAWSLPMGMRVDAHQGKRVLREVLARYVPRDLFERPKAGFGVPIERWLTQELREWAEGLLDPIRLRRHGLLKPEAVERIWRQHLCGWRNHEQLIWSILMFEAWHERWIDAPLLAA